MIPLSIMGLFCEDIREEGGEVFTLIGLLPDVLSVTVQAMPSQKVVTRTANFGNNKFLSKLCFFARANFDPTDPVSEIPFRLSLASGQEIPGGTIQSDVIKRAKEQSIEKKLPLAGVTIRAILGGFIPPLGIHRLEAKIDSEWRMISVLSVVTGEVTSSSSAPVQPS